MSFEEIFDLAVEVLLTCFQLYVERETKTVRGVMERAACGFVRLVFCRYCKLAPTIEPISGEVETSFFSIYTPGVYYFLGGDVRVCYIFRIALLLSLFLRVVGERRGLSSPPRPDTSSAAPAISRLSRQHVYRLSLPIILWYHTVTPYYDTSRVPNYSRLQLST